MRDSDVEGDDFMTGKNTQTILMVVALTFVAISIALQFTPAPAILSLACALLGLGAAILLIVKRRSGAN